MCVHGCVCMSATNTLGGGTWKRERLLVVGNRQGQDSKFISKCCCCYCCQVASVVSDSCATPETGHQPTSLLRPWDSPGKNTGVGCHFLFRYMKVKSESEVTQLCLTLHDPMDCSLPGSSVHGIFQARVLEWGAIAFSKSANDISPKKPNSRLPDICNLRLVFSSLF